MPGRNDSSAYLRSVVVPLYNEAGRLPERLDRLLSVVDDSTELILVDDGSTDGTVALLEREIAGRAHIRLLRLPSNQGKGAAVRTGIAAAAGQFVAFMDADLATDPAYLEPLFASLDDYDIAIGSRSLADTELAHTSRLRSLSGASFNRLVRAATRMPYRDTQCGFKAFHTDVARVLFSLSRLGGFAFDVEILSLARALQFRVTEVPIKWTEMPGTHIRPIMDPLRMSVDVIRSRSSQHRRSCTLPTVDVLCPVGDEGRVHRVVAHILRTEHPTLTGSGSVHILMPFSSHAARQAVRTRALDREYSGHGVSDVQLGVLDAERVLRLAASGPTPGLSNRAVAAGQRERAARRPAAAPHHGGPRSPDFTRKLDAAPVSAFSVPSDD